LRLALGATRKPACFMGINQTNGSRDALPGIRETEAQVRGQGAGSGGDETQRQSGPRPVRIGNP